MRSFTILSVISLCTIMSAFSAWNIETIDGLPWLTPGFDCIADESGIIHGTFYDSLDQDLYYVKITNGSWIYQKIDAVGNSGQYSGIALDSASKPHVVYTQHAQNQYHLIYASLVNDFFFSEIIETTNEPIRNCSLTISSNDIPHVVAEENRYVDQVTYFVKLNNSWSSTIFGAGQYPKIALDTFGIPHVCFRSKTIGRLNVYKKDVNDWTMYQIQMSAYTSEEYSFDIDSSNRVHSCFYNNNSGILTYAWKDYSSTLFDSIQVGTPSQQLSSHAFALSSNNYPHILFYSNSSFRYFYQTAPTTFHTETAGNVYSSENLKMKSPGFIGGYMHVLTFDGTASCFIHGKNSSSDWTFTPTQHRQAIGQISKCVIDSDDHLHVLYLDSLQTSLKYAEQAETGWLISTLLNPADSPGTLFDIALDSLGNVYFSYIRNDDQSLWYGTINAADLSLVEVFPAEMFQWDCNLEFDLNDEPHLFTFRYPSNDLVELHQTTNYWKLLTLDSTLMTPSKLSVVFDSTNHFHMSYYNEYLLYKKNYQPSVFITDLGVNNVHQIALDSEDKPSISYNDTEIELSISNYTGNYWRHRSVSNQAYKPSEHSLWIASTDQPYLAFKNRNNQCLEFTWRDTVDVWNNVIVDSAGDTGHAPKMFKGQDLNHRIVYSNGKLKYAVQDIFAPPTPTPIPTPTPVPAEGSGCEIYLSHNWFTAADLFDCSIRVFNDYSVDYQNIPLFVIFEIAGSFYFAPGFNDFDHYRVDLSPFHSQRINIFQFAWPDNSGTHSGAKIYAAMTKSDYSQIWGSMDITEFGWGD